MENEELSNLQNNEEFDNVNAADETQGAELEHANSEDTPSNELKPNGFESVIENQNKIIEALTKQNNRLAEQIQGLLRNGSSVTPDNEKMKMPEHKSLKEDYIPLSDLGAEIGKKEQH